MRNQIINYLFFWFLYFLFLTVVNGFYPIVYWPLYLGGLVGLFIMPNLDHLLHIFVFKTEELTSVRIIELVKSKRFFESLSLLFDTREERKELIFHSVQFQIIFSTLSFWVVSSSNNIFAKGLVLSYLLGLILFDYAKFKKNEMILNTSDGSRNFTITLLLALFIFGFLI